MNKNGKTIKCRVCDKEFYLSGSRIGIRKYCSRECALKDNYGFKPREKECIECGKKFVIDSGLKVGNKTCSNECRYKQGIKRAREQRERKKDEIVNIVCRYCGKNGTTNKYNNSKYCSNDCRFKHMSEKRMGKNNPAYRNGFAVTGSRKYIGKHLRACSKYKKDFLEKNEYLYCESCGVNINGTMKFETHHIYFASRHPKHTELHNSKNLMLLCVQCHNDFHSSKREKEFEKIERERGLKKLFKINEN